MKPYICHACPRNCGMLRGEYGQRDVYVGTPCIVNRDGVRRSILMRNPSSAAKMDRERCFFQDARCAAGFAKIMPSHMKGLVKQSARTACVRSILS